MQAVTTLNGSSLVNPDAVLEKLRDIAKNELAPLAGRIDQQGFYPVDTMRALGGAGAFSAHLDRYGQRFDLALSAMQTVSRYCGSTGFITWCQDVCGLYMEQSENSHLLSRLDSQAFAKTLGGTGLSNPMKSLTGIEAMALHATKSPRGYRVSGTLPWVSNIASGQYFAAVAAVKDDKSKASHEIFFLIDIRDRVKLNKCPKFSGMEGTSTWGVTLDNYEVDETNIIADPAQPFIKRIRPAFVLLQMGWGFGVIEGAIASCWEVENSLGHVNQYLHNRPSQLEDELAELRERVMLLARDPYCGDKHHVINVLDARAQTSELALKASESALLHQGARGYLMDSDPQRRVREAHFVAIVTPAIKHLRWEISKLMSENMPA
ncbi:MAG: acyl-CoA/acyl-ACP dehydrogenase [Cellvibrionaceae bacterium]|nr:acyl-CoA/acyl-ACP dehydrogenase [Cellvibrionaceae bacterium]